ncbi:DNA helicase [Arthrobacter phage Atuin]|nr:DNA helicase [Arthrobacter phage Atuin]
MAQGREIRTGQATLGQGIIDAIATKGNLVAQASTGTGKSFAALIPMIDAIRKAPLTKRTFRGIISTETLTLQRQIFNKDLPFLQSLYPGFTYRKLMGRTNYLCLNVADQAAVGDMVMNTLVQKLKMRQSSLEDGEQADVERVLGRELTPDQWSRICSTSAFCADNQCSGEECYSTKARANALTADLVVVNHAVLATDVEMKAGMPDSDGLLGPFNCLVVDEGHQLEPVLVSQWTKEISERDVETMASSIAEGISHGQAAKSHNTIGFETDYSLDLMRALMQNVKKFFMLLEPNDWHGSSSALSLKYPMGMPSAALATAMNEYETENPVRLVEIDNQMEKTEKYLTLALATAKEEKIKGLRKISKGLRACKDLRETVQIMSKALETKDGIIQQYGVYGALVDGWEKRDGTPGMTIRLVPLDVSQRAKAIWGVPGHQSNILLSATLTDLTDGTFRYARECIGFPAGPEIDVDTPFSLAEQQLVYVTPANREQVEGARYSFSELFDLISVAKGRTLVLFTSRKELDYAADMMLQLRASGQLPYNVLVQTKDSNKDKLAEDFKRDTHSILLATKSFFVGVDVPGEALSVVALAKFPLPRFSAECKQQISHWRSRGFSKWYEREALTVFQQAAGRLIRSSGCKGVVALLDFRAMDTTNQVYKTASLGVKSLGSPVTQDLNKVKAFLQ